MTKVILENLDCADCASRLEAKIRSVAGVRAATIHFPTLMLHVDAADLSHVHEAIRSFDPALVFRTVESERLKPPAFPWPDFSWILALAALYFALLLCEAFRAQGAWDLWIAAGQMILYALAGWTVLAKAVRNFLRGDLFDEHFLMTLATVTAMLLGLFAEAAGVMIFYRTGEFFQELALGRSRHAIQALLRLRPDRAWIEKDGQWTQTDPQSLVPGVLIRVLPGERVPLDGQVLDGRSLVDASALTGESVPKPVGPGQNILAGMINGNGVLKLTVLRPFADSFLKKIMDLVESASLKKARVERFFTSFARIYTPVVLTIAVLVAVLPPLTVPGAAWEPWIYRALVILMISCPCALVISIPLTYFGGIGAASRRGILVKGAQALDTLTAVRTVVFDKTGTLTHGRFEVLEVRPAQGISEGELWAHVSGLESQSGHPIAQAIRTHHPAPALSAFLDVREWPGQGLSGTHGRAPALAGSRAFLQERGIDVPGESSGESEVHAACDGRYLGMLILGDRLRPQALEALEELRREGVRHLVMLTGDTREKAEVTAGQLRMDNFEAGLLPHEKYERLARIRGTAGAGKTAFVGDGINDAPVLASADVGIAMGGLGADAALESADIVLMNDNLSALPAAFRISRATRAILWQNIVLALGVKTAFMALGVLGLAGMWEAVFADVGVTLLAVLNASRVISK